MELLYRNRVRCGRNRLVVGFTTTCTQSVPITMNANCCEFQPGSWRGVRDTTLCDKVCQ